jgi:hypothetical protein
LLCTAQENHVSEINILKKDHPRLLLLKGEEQQIKAAIERSPLMAQVHEALLEECDAICQVLPIERIQIGRRLLDKSQEALRRIFFLSYAYRMTQDEKYFKRAEKELLAISAFSDWNPSHFLDVAEMTMAAAIGYDWLYDQLSPASRGLIRKAIIEKGLKPSFINPNDRFTKVTHNWNQVCNAGMTFGALAIAEENQALAKQVIDRALATIHLSMDEYNPDGAYPEGYHYWGYGTSFNVLFLSALEKALGTDYGLSASPGFLKTAGFKQHMTAPTGKPFNYSDSDMHSGLSPVMFYFAEKLNDPSLLWIEKEYIRKLGATRLSEDDYRIMPALMVWGKNIDLQGAPAPDHKAWMGQGPNPVYLMRTSWSDTRGIYLGFKAGSASVNHGHMDVGSFVMEADGVRWSSDLERQPYESLESKGLNIFGRSQDAQRWTIFRNNNFSHSTLTVNNQLQRVDGYAKIDHYADEPNFKFAVSDLSTVYDGQLASIRRGVAILDEQYVVIRDEIKASSSPETTIRWTMLTEAEVTITSKTSALLTKDGKTLRLQVKSPASVQLKTWSTAPTTDYDAPNPGTVLLGFEYDLPANSSHTLQVVLIPQSAGNLQVLFDQKLEAWKP